MQRPFGPIAGMSRLQALSLCASLLFLASSVVWRLRCECGLNWLGPAATVPDAVAHVESGAPGAVVTHAFVVRNHGLSSLVVKRIDVQCSCTTAMASESRIEPGGEAQITVHVQLSPRQGSIEQTVWVETNDKCRPRIPLTLKVRMQSN